MLRVDIIQNDQNDVTNIKHFRNMSFPRLICNLMCHLINVSTTKPLSSIKKSTINLMLVTLFTRYRVHDY